MSVCFLLQAFPASVCVRVIVCVIEKERKGVQVVTDGKGVCEFLARVRPKALEFFFLSFFCKQNL